MIRADWLPKAHRAFRSVAERILAFLHVKANRERVGIGENTPQGEWIDKELLPLFPPYMDAYDAWEDRAERTMLKTLALRLTETDLKKNLRPFYTGMIKGNPLVTNVDLEIMGLPLRRSSADRSPVHKADESPEIHVELLAPGRFRLYFHRAGAGIYSGKLKGQLGVEVAWMVLKAPREVFVEDLEKLLFEPSSIVKFDFMGKNSGERFYFAARWVNTRGKRGSWSDVRSITIP
ncbi:MAG: hypothetical protein LBG30_06100 [Odoribacteraceae bacterium]|jgi:hypothetical protein|nr:hypothetical protein [Odoribacteraceae bacterium]